MPFITQHEVVAKDIDDPGLKLKTLMDSVSEKVAEHIDHCQTLPPEWGYECALDILRKKYGNPVYVREAIVGDLKKDYFLQIK